MSRGGRRSGRAPGSLPWMPAPPGWLGEVPLAHRGLHDDEAVENSLPAFAAAAAAGYGVELDVLLSRDEVPVVLHDHQLSRATGVVGKVGELTAAELGRLRLFGTDATIPTLVETLDVLRDVPVMVELKQPRLRAGRLEERAAEVLDGHAGPWCVASFNPASVRWFRRYRPDAVRVLTSGPLADAPLPGPIRTRLSELRDLGNVAPHAVSYDLAGLPTSVTDAWRERGGVLVAWTAVGPVALDRARDLADNVIFEHVRP